MKVLVVNRKITVSILTLFGFAFLVTLGSVVPASATDFEVGTQFGISHLLISDDNETASATFIQIPGGLISGFTLPTLYATWFPGKQFAIGPEFSFGGVSIEDSSITSLYLGGRAAYFLNTHSMSSPYVSGRISLYTLFADEEDSFSEVGSLASFGAGFGYQWRIGPALILRAEGQYQRLFPFEETVGAANELSFIIGLGTRFGKAEVQF